MSKSPLPPKDGSCEMQTPSFSHTPHKHKQHNSPKSPHPEIRKIQKCRKQQSAQHRNLNRCLVGPATCHEVALYFFYEIMLLPQSCASAWGGVALPLLALRCRSRLPPRTSPVRTSCVSFQLLPPCCWCAKAFAWEALPDFCLGTHGAPPPPPQTNNALPEMLVAINLPCASRMQVPEEP